MALISFVFLFAIIDRGTKSILNFGLDRYFGLNQLSKILFIGHSQLMLAVDKQTFEQAIQSSISKYCREGVNVADRNAMIKQYLSLPCSDSLKVVFYGVDQFLFTGAGLSQNSYKLFYPFIDNPNIDRYIKESTNEYDYWLHKIICSTRYSDALINSAIRGWRKDWSNYKEGNLNIEALIKQINQGQQRRIHFEKELVDSFEETLHVLTQKNIKVILVNTPIAKPLNDYEPEAYQKMIHYFEQKAATSPLIYYWDMNPEYSENYELFFDPIHLNPKGQKVITKQLIINSKQINLTRE